MRIEGADGGEVEPRLILDRLDRCLDLAAAHVVESVGPQAGKHLRFVQGADILRLADKECGRRDLIRSLLEHGDLPERQGNFPRSTDASLSVKRIVVPEEWPLEH